METVHQTKRDGVGSTGPHSSLQRSADLSAMTPPSHHVELQRHTDTKFLPDACVSNCCSAAPHTRGPAAVAAVSNSVLVPWAC